MTRTLKDYRPQHDEDCESRICRECGSACPNPVGANPCSCGLEALLVTDEKDQSRSDQPQPGRCDADPRGDDRGGSMLPSGNWHAIEGPNGMCACGPNNGCPERLQRAFMDASQPRWRRIETAPKDGAQILLWITGIEPRPRIGFWSERGSDSGWYGLQSQHFIGVNVTHWMPLPNGPQQQGGPNG